MKLYTIANAQVYSILLGIKEDVGNGCFEEYQNTLIFLAAYYAEHSKVIDELLSVEDELRDPEWYLKLFNQLQDTLDHLAPNIGVEVEEDELKIILKECFFVKYSELIKEPPEIVSEGDLQSRMETLEQSMFNIEHILRVIKEQIAN